MRQSAEPPLTTPNSAGNADPLDVTRQQAAALFGVPLALLAGRPPTATWQPARPGDTPGELVPEHGPTMPVDLAALLGAVSMSITPAEALDLLGDALDAARRERDQVRAQIGEARTGAHGALYATTDRKEPLMKSDDEVFTAAVAAAQQHVGGTSEQVAAALLAADEVATAAEEAEALRMVAATGMAGMGVEDGAVALRLVLAHEMAAKTTLAWRTMLDAHPQAVNYIEQDIRDPETGGRYTFIVVRPGGSTPHALRVRAERERDQAVAELARVRAELAEMAGPDFHIIQFSGIVFGGSGDWTIQHPLACRPNLFDCPYNAAAEMSRWAAQGRYRCELTDGVLVVGERIKSGDDV